MLDFRNLIFLNYRIPNEILSQKGMENRTVQFEYEKRPETGFKGGQFCVQLDVFLFEHGSGSDPNLIPVLDYPEIRLQEWTCQNER